MLSPSSCTSLSLASMEMCPQHQRHLQPQHPQQEQIGSGGQRLQSSSLHGQCGRRPRVDQVLLSAGVDVGASGAGSSEDESGAAYSQVSALEFFGCSSGPGDKPKDEASRAPGGRNLFQLSNSPHSMCGGHLPADARSRSRAAGCSASPGIAQRKIAQVPFKVVDALQLRDDFGLNLVDWSSTNILSLGLSDNECSITRSASRKAMNLRQRGCQE